MHWVLDEQVAQLMGQGRVAACEHATRMTKTIEYEIIILHQIRFPSNAFPLPFPNNPTAHYPQLLF